jgi:hypothetical protein
LNPSQSIIVSPIKLGRGIELSKMLPKKDMSCHLKRGKLYPPEVMRIIEKVWETAGYP